MTEERHHCPFCGEGYGDRGDADFAWEAWDAVTQYRDALDEDPSEAAEATATESLIRVGDKMREMREMRDHE